MLIDIPKMMLKSAKQIAETIANAKLLTGREVIEGDKRISIVYMAGVEVLRIEGRL